MGTKKIIAICQSGGEFITGDDGSLVYDGGEAYAVDVDQDTRLDDLKQELAEMFQYSIDDILIKYFLPGHRKTLISVSREKDLQRMVNFCEDFDQVEVFVINDSGVALNVPIVPGSRYSNFSFLLNLLCQNNFHMHRLSVISIILAIYENSRCLIWPHFCALHVFIPL